MTYSVNAMVNGKVIAKEKQFSNEKDAKKYIYNLIETYSCEVDEEYYGIRGLEFYCDNYTRFSIQAN